MDADYTKRRRESEKSRRERRWSMNSQRLEEIVAELMKPISDVRRNFDTDLCALLEEYLTEAGLRALEEGEEVDGDVSAGEAAPNFAELALLLQQSACIYSRKVDYLYQHVLSVSDSLHNCTQEASSHAEEPQTPSRRRKRKCSAAAAIEFSAIEVQTCAGARRDGAARPPPTLPRGYIELEPRVMHAEDAPLLDYAGEPIGLLTDFEVTWRLQDGLLVDELQVGGGGGAVAGSSDWGRLRAVPLAELHAALAAAAPPDPPPAAPSPEPDADAHDPIDNLNNRTEPAPLACSTPQPLLPPPPPPVPRELKRKRRNDVSLEELAGVGKILISAELRQRLSQVEEFSLPRVWIARVVHKRKARILSARQRLRDLEGSAAAGFRGFDITDSTDIGGFLGWTISEAETAACALLRRRLDSDDDGFFDQSSSGESDDCAALPGALGTSLEGSAEWAAWRDAVVERAAASAARSFSDMRAAGAAVLRAITAATATDDTAAPDAGAPCDALLAAAVEHPTDVSRVFLATLFLANAGNVEIVQGPPLTLNSFSVRLLSSDQRLYYAATDLER